MKALNEHADIIREVAKELGIKEKFARKAIRFYYKSLGDFLGGLDLNNPEPFRDINVPHLFTIVPTYKKALGQIYRYNYRQNILGKDPIDMDDFRKRALEDMEKLKPELREKRKKSQARPNRYNIHRDKINKKRNNENIHNGASDTSDSTRDANDKGV